MSLEICVGRRAVNWLARASRRTERRAKALEKVLLPEVEERRDESALRAPARFAERNQPLLCLVPQHQTHATEAFPER
jgi:hypothetical protein